MGQEIEIPSGGRCSRGDYGSVQETFLTFSMNLVTFFKESCGLFQGIQSALSKNPICLFQGIQSALSKNPICLFKESSQPFQRILSAFSRNPVILFKGLFSPCRGFGDLYEGILSPCRESSQCDGCGGLLRREWRRIRP